MWPGARGDQTQPQVRKTLGKKGPSIISIISVPWLSVLWWKKNHGFSQTKKKTHTRILHLAFHHVGLLSSVTIELICLTSNCVFLLVCISARCRWWTSLLHWLLVCPPVFPCLYSSLTHIFHSSSLTLLDDSLPPETEPELRSYISRRLSKGALLGGMGNIATVELRYVISVLLSKSPCGEKLKLFTCLSGVFNMPKDNPCANSSLLSFFFL